MKLSEALIEKSHLNKKISEIKERLVANGKIQEGDSVVEDPESLFSELGGVYEQLLSLNKRIAVTNSQTQIDENKKISDILIEKDIMEKKICVLKHVLEESQVKIGRFSRSEIK